MDIGGACGLGRGRRPGAAELAAKRVGLDLANRLVAGAARIRLAAFSLDSLGDRPPIPSTPSPPAPARRSTAAGTDAVDHAAHALCQTAGDAHRWYARATTALADGHIGLDEVPSPPTDLPVLVVEALDEARASRWPDRVRHTLSLIWTERHLARQHRLQRELADQADQLLALRRRW